jgi:hypothetical protein
MIEVKGWNFMIREIKIDVKRIDNLLRPDKKNFLKLVLDEDEDEVTFVLETGNEDGSYSRPLFNLSVADLRRSIPMLRYITGFQRE